MTGPAPVPTFSGAGSWIALAPALLLAVPSLAAAPPRTDGLDTARIERLTGAKGTLDPKQHVFKVSAPRTDLQIVSAHWGVGSAQDLARGLRAALEKTGVRLEAM